MTAPRGGPRVGAAPPAWITRPSSSRSLDRRLAHVYFGSRLAGRARGLLFQLVSAGAASSLPVLSELPPPCSWPKRSPPRPDPDPALRAEGEVPLSRSHRGLRRLYLPNLRPAAAPRLLPRNPSSSPTAKSSSSPGLQTPGRLGSEPSTRFQLLLQEKA